MEGRGGGVIKGNNESIGLSRTMDTGYLKVTYDPREWGTLKGGGGINTVAPSFNA